MTIEDLKRLKISGWTVFSRMQKYGWIDDAGREIPWTRWVNRKGREELGYGLSFVTIPLPATKTAEERAEARMLSASNRGFKRTLRHNFPRHATAGLKPILGATRHVVAPSWSGFSLHIGGPVGQDVESRGLALLFFAPPEIAPVYTT
jgi:hypothetical protein